MAQSSRSSSNVEQRNDNGVKCYCNWEAKITRAWTDRYESCKFFDWFDLEKPNGWQYEALLEVRDTINRQKEDLKGLREIVSSLEREGGSTQITHSSEVGDELKLSREECELLKREVLILTERSKVYRNVLITSSVGFTVVIGIMMLMWK